VAALGVCILPTLFQIPVGAEHFRVIDPALALVAFGGC
jgi:hypothetical protein